jgi:putative transcriptional regulator
MTRSSTREATNIMKKGRKVRNKGKTSTQISMGAAIIEALDEAISFVAGEKTGATVRTVTARRAKGTPAPKYRGEQIARLRKLMKLSQPVFADALNVSSASVKSWEQGVNQPSGAALRLLQIAERHPEVILERITTR